MKNILSTEIITNINEIREKIKDLKKQNLTIGFVPTMGALHVGHESLIQRAKQECDAVIVSIFVNPIQFGPNEDFDKYPRQLEADRDICSKNGVDLIFAPTAKEMYPEGKESLTTIVPPASYQNKLCGKSRKGHFNGVATVVAKLFNIIIPDRAYFGRKDAQQLVIIKKITRDLDLPVKIIDCPTVRNSEGLACSSRNKYLSKDSREKALSIYRALKKAEGFYNSGITSTAEVINQAKKLLHPEIELEYFEAFDFENLEFVEKLKENTIIAIAAKIDEVRLIDNIFV